MEILEKDKPIYGPQEEESSVSAENPAQYSDAIGRDDVVAGGDDETSVADDAGGNSDDMYDTEEGFAGAADGHDETGPYCLWYQHYDGFRRLPLSMIDTNI